MYLSNIVILVDRFERGVDLVEAVQAFASCRISVGEDCWLNSASIGGIIVNMPTDNCKNDDRLKIMRSKIGYRSIPTVFIMQSSSEIEIKYAKKLGATACLPISSETSEIVSTLFRQIAPNKTLTDLLVERSLVRTSALYSSMFEAGRTGVIDIVAIENAGDPVVSALRQGGLRRWLDLVQVHDDMTVRHCLLVAGLVANFAIHLGLSAKDRSTLVSAGLVHDVGKAQVPLAILNKPGPLDADEMALMRTHAKRGHDILVSSGVSDPLLLSGTRHHHEMLDGSGYPDGLRGQQIGDAVRLLTVCDIYAALTECRPYRAGMQQSEAMQVLRSMAPNRLEMAIVEAFANSLGHNNFTLPVSTPSLSQALAPARYDSV